MATPAAATPPAAAAPSEDRDFGDRIANANVSTLVKVLKVFNFINAAFLCTAGILVFVLLNLTLLLVLSAIYVIVFSLLLLCFECHLKRFEKMVYKNFGFMFHWQGRCLFFFFVGTLAFGLGDSSHPWGIIAGTVTVLNVLFNIYVLRNNDLYRQHLHDQTSEMRARARSDLAKPAAGATPGAGAAAANQPATYNYNSSNNPTNTLAGAALNAAAANPEAAVKVATIGINVAAQTATVASEWEKFLDEDTGTYYYYNSRTQETRWEEPK